MFYTKLLKEVDKNDISTGGGKAASLGEMIQAGILVPLGFVVLTEAFDHFCQGGNLNVKIDAILYSVKPDETQAIKNASEKIQALILQVKIPTDIAEEIKTSFAHLDTTYVAVRSSATVEDSSSAAWAGQLDSYLNTTKENLLENIKKCWASLFSPRAISYRFEKSFHQTKISVAVVIQKMIESEISGIAFSVHPVTEDRNQLIIEAGSGLGEDIVSGQITPDSYVVEKELWRIIAKNVPDHLEQKLSDKQILELAKIIIEIENLFGFPCDIEWTYKNEKFYILQSRPITTLIK